MINHDHWDELKARMTAFWNREPMDRCCAAICVQHPWPDDPGGKHFYYDAATADAVYRGRFAHQTHFGESHPCLFPYFGTAGVAEYTGCHAEHRPHTTWFMPWMDDDEPDASRISYSHPDIFARQKAAISELIALSGGDYTVSVTDNAGVLDALAAIRGTDNLMMDMLTDPEFVEDALQRLLPIYKQTQEELFSLVQENNDGSVLAWMQLWSPRRMAQMQCDLSVMISPEMFNRFAMPELEELCSFLDYPVYHFDGMEQIRHLDSLLSLKKLRAIQWTHVAGQPSPLEFIPVLQKIQQAGKNLIIFPHASEVVPLLDQLSSTGLHLSIGGIRSEDEARDMMQLIRQHSRERSFT